MTALQSESIAAVTKALLAAKAKFKPAVKDAENPHFGSSFLSLRGVLGAVADALAGEKLLLAQQTDVEMTPTGPVPLLVTRVIHESGEWLSSRYLLRPVKADPQSDGSALTYARRYAAMALLGIAAEDDDGNAASTRRDEIPDEPPPPDPRTALFSDVKAAGFARHLTEAEIADDFAGWAEGTRIQDATAEQLTRYVGHLKKAEK
jgi:hypothetical protein